MEINIKVQNKERMFFALDISPDAKQSIVNWSKQLASPNLKCIKPDNFHITLAFLGVVSEKEKKYLIEQSDLIHQQLDITKQDTELTADTLALFKKPQVLYLGFSSFPLPLKNLADKLSKQALHIGLFQETRMYTPHITIARKAKKPLQTKKLSIPFAVASFSLYLSQSSEVGVIYSPVKTWVFE